MRASVIPKSRPSAPTAPPLDRWGAVRSRTAPPPNPVGTDSTRSHMKTPLSIASPYKTRGAVPLTAPLIQHHPSLIYTVQIPVSFTAAKKNQCKRAKPRRLKRIATKCTKSVDVTESPQTQRVCVSKPRVATQELPWVPRPKVHSPLPFGTGEGPGVRASL